eukprot:4823845-Pyramimonas_sp.AAC.1
MIVSPPVHPLRFVLIWILHLLRLLLLHFLLLLLLLILLLLPLARLTQDRSGRCSPNGEREGQEWEWHER